MLSKKSWSYNPWIGDPKVMNCKSLSMMVCYSLGNQDFQECCVTCTVVHESHECCVNSYVGHN